MNRRLWHITPEAVERKRYFWQAILPFLPAIATAGAGILGSMFGGKGKSKEKERYDPLAGLRSQLQDLASGVPGLVARQKALTAERVGRARTQGYQDIGENIHAEKGFGRTSLENELQRKLVSALEEKQSAADLVADIWGTGEQANILKGTESMYLKEEEEEPSWGTNLLGAGMGMLGQNWQQQSYLQNIKNSGLFGGGTTTPSTGGGGGFDWMEMLSGLLGKNKQTSQYLTL